MSEFGVNGIRNSEFGKQRHAAWSPSTVRGGGARGGGCAPSVGAAPSPNPSPEDGGGRWSAPRADATRLSCLLFPVPCPLSPRRRGVTLVELLITITIIALLGTAILGVASVATNSAREARSRDKIARLHGLLMEHYDSYKVRRVKLNQQLQNTIDGAANPRARGEALATARLYALRELMLMEMPDRWSDVVLNSVGDPPRQLPLYYAERTGLSNLYLRQYLRLNPTVENQSAECLYMIIMYATGDGEARALFGENDIGDSDGDGAPEFIDGWGNPIQFLRWAPGFESDAQLNVYRFNGDNNAWTVAADADHDPFDLFRRDRFAFRLQPLIYSAGSDEEFGIETNDAEQVWYTVNVVTPANPTTPPYSYFAPHLSPYQQISASIPFTGTPIDSSRQPDVTASTDNIHSHLIGTR